MPTHETERNIGRYWVLASIESAPEQATYRAWSPLSAQTVFVRHFRRGALPDPAMQALHAWCTRLAGWHHPFALPLIEAGFHKGGSFAATPYQPVSLAAQLRATPVAPSLAFLWARQIAGVLSAAAAAGIRHGHLTAHNVFIDSNGSALVADFGLARFRQLAREHLLDPARPAEALAARLLPTGPAFPDAVDRQTLINLLTAMLRGINPAVAGGQALDSGYLPSESAESDLPLPQLVDRLEEEHRRATAITWPTRGPFASTVLSSGVRTVREEKAPIPALASDMPPTPEAGMEAAALDPDAWLPLPADDAPPPAPPDEWPAFDAGLPRSPWRIALAVGGAALLMLLAFAWVGLKTPVITSFVRPSVSLPETGGPAAGVLVEAVEGEARVQPPGFHIALPVEPGAMVRLGDELSAGPGGSLRFRLDPAISVMLYGDTSVTAVSQGTLADPTTWLNLTRGAISVSFESDASVRQVLVVTPWGTASVSGSAMGVLAVPEAPEVRLACFHGNCRLSLPDRQLPVPSGSELRYFPLTDLASERPLDTEPDDWGAIASRPAASPTARPLPSSTPLPPATETPTPTATATAVKAAAPRPTLVPPTDTVTLAPSPTATADPTHGDTDKKPSPTPVPRTSTPVPTPTRTPSAVPPPTPTRTPSPVPSPTATRTREPSDTPTPLPTGTASPTAILPTITLLPPTATPVPTDTPSPPTPTDTPVPPTDTPVPPTDTSVPPTDTPIP